MSSEYKKAQCCGADCRNINGSSDEPCWGEVEVIDEYYDKETDDSYWIHVCEGHLNNKYVSPPEKRKAEE